MILTCARLGYAGVALTDHEALCGHVEWLELEQELKEKKLIPENFKCALGNEIYLTDDRRENQKYWHFLLIAKNTIGHRALRELSSTAWLNSYRYRGLERVPTLKQELKAIVKKYPNSLIADNACLGSELDHLVVELANAEQQQDIDLIHTLKIQIDEFMHFCIDLFGEDFYIELAPGISKDQKIFNQRIKPIAEFYKRKMVIGCDAHYLRAKDREIHKAFLNSKEGEREVDSFYHDAHFMSDEEAYNNLQEFYTRVEFNQMCANSIELMNKIEEYQLFHNPIIPEVEVPKSYPYFDESLKNYPNLQKLRDSDNPQEREWVNRCLKSLTEKKLVNDKYMARLELEADVLNTISKKMDNCLYSYFNTYCHYIDLFWDCGSVVGPGRGSSGSFLSNFLLGITQLDPIIWDFPYFRFLNKERAELPDIDCDLAPSKRPLILQKIRQERGELNVVQVATFGTETSKAAVACGCRGYRSKDCPNGIDNDIAQYLSSLIPSERGITRSIGDCLYGNEDKGWKPIKELVNQLNQYPGLAEIILGVEGLICRRGQHASGVIMYNNSPYDTTALMRSPNGDITTQFDLHRSEKLGDTKFDFLITEICEKIGVCLELLQERNYFPKNLSLREVYNEYLHPQKINLADHRLWQALKNNEVLDVFQFNTDIGAQTVKAIAPTNPTEMTAANALMRLVAPEGQERPFDRYLRFKDNIGLWYKEMTEAGLSPSEQKTLEPYYKKDYGVPASQEQLMLMVMDPQISNFTLAESNQCRKVLAKKKIKEIPIIKEKFLTQCPSQALGEYCWKTMMEPQMSYSFSQVHSTLYTFIGIQTLVLATQFPSIYWNCACLIVNSQSSQQPEDSDDDINSKNCYEETQLPKNNKLIVDNDDDEDSDDIDDNDTTIAVAEKKKKQNSCNYDKIAAAIGKMRFAGIEVAPPDINYSTYTFSVDKNEKIIRYGMSGITGVGEDVIKAILINRPYLNWQDFSNKVKIKKPQMVNLIKCGAFDEIEPDRITLMREYVASISDQKKRITLQNLQMLINFNLIPEDFDFVKRVFNFNKYLKKQKKATEFQLDNIAFNFYEKNFSIDFLNESADAESGFSIDANKWDDLYQKVMDQVRPWLKANAGSLLNQLNTQLMSETWNKYCLGNLSKWEMDSISCYSHPHELANIQQNQLGIVNFYDLNEQPLIDRILTIKGKQVPIFKIYRIAGTVLGRNKTKKTLTLLTTDGVVLVKIFGEIFSYYDKQVSERGVDGKKHVIRKSEFSRGNKVIITGIRREDSFIAKKYKSTPYHLVDLIEEVDDNGMLKVSNRHDLLGDE